MFHDDAWQGSQSHGIGYPRLDLFRAKEVYDMGIHFQSAWTLELEATDDVFPTRYPPASVTSAPRVLNSIQIECVDPFRFDQFLQSDRILRSRVS